MRGYGVGAFLVIALAGCSSSGDMPAAAPPPKYSPDEIANAILADYDKNQDGAIDVNEARACPALYYAFNEIDANRDKKLSTDELHKRAEAWSAVATGSVQVNCVVKLDGAPLPDATVTFEPEKCMGPNLKPATAKTDANGFCDEYQIEGKKYRGLPSGLFRIRVTKDGLALPAQYNTQSVLGREVYYTLRTPTVSVELKLTSR